MTVNAKDLPIYNLKINEIEQNTSPNSLELGKGKLGRPAHIVMGTWAVPQEPVPLTQGGRRFRHGGRHRPPVSLSPTLRETNFRKKNDFPRFGKRIFERKMTSQGPGNGFLKEK